MTPFPQMRWLSLHTSMYEGVVWVWALVGLVVWQRVGCVRGERRYDVAIAFLWQSILYE